MNSFHTNFNIGILNGFYRISSSLCWITKPITVYFLMKKRIITAKISLKLVIYQIKINFLSYINNIYQQIAYSSQIVMDMHKYI